MKNTVISLRKWQAEDIEMVYNLVVQLAIYEREPDAVTTTIADYREAFNHGLIAGHLAILPDGNVAGMTLFYETFSTWKGRMLYLEDFFVKEAYRQCGIGQQLFNAYMEEAKIRHCAHLKWQVLDWNEPAISFYNKIGATILKDWWTCRLTLEEEI